MRLALGVVASLTLVVIAGCRSETGPVASPDNTRPAVTGVTGATGTPNSPDARWVAPPTGRAFDYQLAEAYQPAAGVDVVARDWFDSVPLEGAYSICYINAYQTQPADDTVDRPDEVGAWPATVVLRDLPDDPNWPGEFLIDLSTAAKRDLAAEHVAAMLDVCARKGFEAVEFDNLDSWTRFDGLGIAEPFDRSDAVAYAVLLVSAAHHRGLAAGRKNTPELDRTTSIDLIGFDFAIAEECGAYDECSAYTDVFGDRVLDIEYTQAGFEAACSSIGDRTSVILRDRDLHAPQSADYRYESCR